MSLLLMKKLALATALLALVSSGAQAATSDAAAQATNALGLDLYAKLADGNGNICFSPYSISCALAMTLDGAAGETEEEMARVLHLDPKQDNDSSFNALQKSLGEIPARAKTDGASGEPIVLSMANRLFAQEGFDFRPKFLAEVKDNFGAAPELLDFENNAGDAREKVNQWVAQQTHQRILDLISAPLSAKTRLILANAIYLKAAWAEKFPKGGTAPAPFHVRGTESDPVPTMVKGDSLGYAKHDGFSLVALPYVGSDLQLVILLPDAVDGWHNLEKKLTPALLAECAKLPETKVNIHLPKFKIEPPAIQLAEELESLGMKSAFDIPAGSANFDRMAPRRPNDYLAISDVFHKAYVSVDENGTEAAAATAVVMIRATAAFRPTEPIEVKVDRPFLYAIQDVSSGACLFLGRVVDPR